MYTDKHNPNEKNKMTASCAEAASGEKKCKNEDHTIGNVKQIFLLEADVISNSAVNFMGQR